MNVSSAGAPTYPPPATIGRAASALQCTTYGLTPPQAQGGFAIEIHLRVPASNAASVMAAVEKLPGVPPVS